MKLSYYSEEFPVTFKGNGGGWGGAAINTGLVVIVSLSLQFSQRTLFLIYFLLTKSEAREKFRWHMHWIYEKRHQMEIEKIIHISWIFQESKNAMVFLLITLSVFLIGYGCFALLSFNWRENICCYRNMFSCWDCYHTGYSLRFCEQQNQIFFTDFVSQGLS